jgi:hypothetical protein
MVAGWGLILVLTAAGKTIAPSFGFNTEEEKTQFVTTVVPATVAGMNAALPQVIFMIITKLEKWDNKQFETQLVIARIFTAKVLNVIIQLVTYIMVSDPYIFKEASMFNVKVGGEDVDSYIASFFQMPLADPTRCRQDNVSYALVNLLVVQFFTSKVIAIGVSFAKLGLYIAKGRKGKWKTEFNVPFAVINLVYFCTVAFITFAYFPFAFLLVAFITFCDFKFIEFQLRYFMYKPLIPFDAKSIGNFFTILLLMAMVIGSGVVHFTLSNPSLPRVFDLKSVPNNPNDDDNYKPGYGLGKELNFEIGLFRYFPANSEDTLVKDDNQKIGNDRKVKLSTIWEPSIPGIVVLNETMFLERKIEIIQNFKDLCKVDNVPVSTYPFISFECCGMAEEEKSDDPGEIKVKKRELAGGRACIPIKQFWENIRKPIDKPSVTVFGRFNRIKRLLKRPQKNSGETGYLYVDNSTQITDISADLACGPFLNADRGYDALLDYIDKKNEILKRIKSVIRDENGGYVMIFWTVIFVLVINYMYKKNTIYTQRIAHSEREGALRNQANALMGRANDLQRKLDLKKRQAAAAVGLK